MCSRQDQRTIRLAGVIIFQEENRRIGGLCLGLAAEAALACPECLGTSDIAGASSDIRSKGHGEAQ